MQKLWPVKKKKGGIDILTNMLPSEDGARLHTRNRGSESDAFALSHRKDSKSLIETSISSPSVRDVIGTAAALHLNMLMCI